MAAMGPEEINEQINKMKEDIQFWKKKAAVWVEGLNAFYKQGSDPVAHRDLVQFYQKLTKDCMDKINALNKSLKDLQSGLDVKPGPGSRPRL